MRTRRTNVKNFIIDFILTVIAIVVAISFVHHRDSADKISTKSSLLKADVKFLTSEIDLVQNSIQQSITGLNQKSKSALSLQESLEEKNYRSIDSLSQVVAEFDPLVIFRPEIVGFEAFVQGDEIKRLTPLSTRKTLLKSMSLLQQCNQAYQIQFDALNLTYHQLIDPQFNENKSRLLNRYFLYNGKISAWLIEYQKQISRALHQLKRLNQSFIQLEDQLDNVIPVPDTK